MSALRNREERINFLYKIYLLQWDDNTAFDKIDASHLEFDFDIDKKQLIRKIVESKSDLEGRIKELLPNDWKLSRINNLEKAVLLNGIAEIRLFDNKKEIVIDESLNFAKRYCDPNSGPLINAILDKI